MNRQLLGSLFRHFSSVKVLGSDRGGPFGVAAGELLLERVVSLKREQEEFGGKVKQ